MRVPPATLVVLLTFVVAPLAGATSYTYAGSGLGPSARQPVLIGPAPGYYCVSGAAALCSVPCPGAVCHVRIRDVDDAAAGQVGSLTGGAMDAHAQVQICDQEADGSDARCYPPGNPVGYPSKTGTIDIFIMQGTAGSVTVS